MISCYTEIVQIFDSHKNPESVSENIKDLTSQHYILPELRKTKFIVKEIWVKWATLIQKQN